MTTRGDRFSRPAFAADAGKAGIGGPCSSGDSQGIACDQASARALVARRAIDDCAVHTGANPWDAEPEVRAMREETAEPRPVPSARRTERRRRADRGLPVPSTHAIARNEPLGCEVEREVATGNAGGVNR